MTEDCGYRIEREVLCENERISGVCLTAADAQQNVDMRTVVGDKVATPRQTHSLNAGIVAHAGEEFPDTDALLCFTPGQPVGVVTADCVPVLVYAPDIRCAGAIHAGWRGTLGGIVDNVLDLLEEKGADLGDLQVYFGPSISQANYEVDEALADRFREEGFSEYVATSEDGTRPHIDLQGINACRFSRRGVSPENIHLHRGCTFGSVGGDGKPRYQSHRRSHGTAGRMLTYIVMH